MKKHILDLNEMTCAYPDKMYGRNVTELKEEEICDAGAVWRMGKISLVKNYLSEYSCKLYSIRTLHSVARNVLNHYYCISQVINTLTGRKRLLQVGRIRIAFA